MLDVTNYPPNSNPDRRRPRLPYPDAPGTLYGHITLHYVPAERLPPEWHRHVHYGVFVLFDREGYLGATEDMDELAAIIQDDSLQPGYSRKRLTGYDYQTLREYTHGPRTSRQPGQPRSKTRSRTSAPAPDLSDLTGDD